MCGKSGNGHRYDQWNQKILVKKPAAKNMAQKNSAKMAICKDKAGPNPIGSLNLVR